MADNNQLDDKIIIIGASHAGLACAEQLRANKFVGPIMLIDRLAGLPYERPPLSKAFLQSHSLDNSANDTKFLLRGDDWFSSLDITLIAGRTTVAIDIANKQITLDDGIVHPYGRLVLATGAVPRDLDMARGLDRVFVLRHQDHARRLRSAIKDSKRAIVIGGGYIGLEVAASLTKAGLGVDVIEMADRLLARVASPPLSAFFADLHKQHDVGIHTGVSGTEIIQDDGVFKGVRLADGRCLEADILLVGIGVKPDVALAETAGIATSNGIVVDAAMRCSIPDIYAIGDVALINKATIRIESVDNATTSAARAVAAICGTPPPPSNAPWFWSEQFDVRLQSAGIVPIPRVDQALGELIHVTRSGKREGGFSVWSYADGHLAAVEAVRDPASYMLGKKCLDLGLSPAPQDVQNADFDLKGFIADKTRS